MISVVPLSSSALRIGSRFRASSGAEMTFSTSPSYPRLGALSSAIVMIAIACVACQQVPVRPPPTVSPTAALTPLVACPLASPPANPQVLARGQPAPDDLAFDND